MIAAPWGLDALAAASDGAAAIAAVFASLFGVGILAAFMRRWWAQQDNAFAADQNARAEERAACEEQIDKLRGEHRAQCEQMRADHIHEALELRRSFDRRFQAMARALRDVVLLVPDGPARQEATEILLRLSVDEGEA
jgi:hypothetical protein